MIYLDNAATSFPKPKEVYEAVDKCLREYGANPGRSGHKLALKAGRIIYETRELICQLFNIDNPMQIIFTYNATDSLNLAIKGILSKGDHVITSGMEHNSVIRPIKALEEIGVENTIVECDDEGIIKVDKLKSAIKKNTKLIAITHASNVTGSLMPIEKISKIAKENSILLLVDAAQTAGVYNIDVKKMNIDLLAFPGHKGLMGPQGTGALYIREGIKLRHMKEGGTGSKSESLLQPEIIPDRYESGTPNTPGIAGLGAGIKYILNIGIDNIRKHEEELTEYMINGLEKINEVIIYGPKDIKRKASVISINIGDLDSSEVSYILDQAFNIAVRSGLHCAPLAHKTLGTFEQGTIRFSIGYFNTKQDIDRALEAIKKICEEME
ncbi:aminotransferase class V-fold PLP-dependent enzyme [Paramaledivibacter caminithermalis]|jgi:cysteine desulfurase family protein|uniref:cysteine desulfurase n=1 Tax=Paramaledivibacter caminithermalis (strain DSM 15212 / CIP 107654 / DViRD3) TaxID=1121301 RepID=A0A1M6NYP0_PARC5|nr:aminotransferase class V-fold PLP-dependent enzyme [Paramaledivibacter caminithermalis]SHK00771.1 cysteine desulfurase family protein [Paramaledivibacter caminithermalis DSM 15212]